MDPSFFGSVLSGVSNLVGGFLGNEANRKANETAQENAVHQQNLQLEAAMKGISWKARDVMNAYKETGIHPLALLGTSGPTYSPVTVSQVGGSPLGESIGRMGQDISRSINATADRELRQRAMDMQMERFTLENELLKARIGSEVARTNQMSAPAMPNPMTRRPPMAVDGQGDSAIKLKQNEVTMQPQPGIEPGLQPDMGFSQTPSGELVPIPSKEFKDRAEDMSWLPFTWFWRNYARPFFDPDNHHPRGKYAAPLGKIWTWDPLRGSWKLEDRPEPRGMERNNPEVGIGPRYKWQPPARIR